MKRILTLLTLVLLVGSASVLGTIAYQKNVAPEGKGIAQVEYQRADDGSLEAFAQNKPFFPASHPQNYDFSANKDSGGFWTGLDGAVDKIVKVKNNGSAPCYFRTLFAFQNTQNTVTNGFLQINWNNTDYQIKKVDSAIEIDGVPYIVYEATCKQALPAGAESPASLLQFALRSDTPYSNMVGAYRILAVSQAYWQEESGETFSINMLPALLGDENTYQAAFENVLK